MSLPKARWHPRYDECQGCGRADRPHIARGYCESCYRKARAAERRQLDEQEEPARVSTLRRGWHHTHAACARCGTTTRPHLRDGLCVDCYRGQNGLGELGREDVPVYHVERRAPTPISVRQSSALPEVITVGSTLDSMHMDDTTMPLGAAGVVGQNGHGPELRQGSLPAALDDDGHWDQFTAVEPAPPITARPDAPVQARRVPRLFARHIRVVRTYAITCPNCGETVRNERTGLELFREEDLPAGTEVACGDCGAWWEIAVGAE